YPSTDTLFTLNSATRIAFTANGAPPPVPLSAGGVLNVFAPDVEQGGTLVAPLGTINLGTAALSDTISFASVVSTRDDFGSPGAAGLGEWDFTATSSLDQSILSSLLPGQSVSLTNGGVTVQGVVEQLTSGTLAVNVTSLTGTAIGGPAPASGSTWSIT